MGITNVAHMSPDLKAKRKRLLDETISHLTLMRTCQDIELLAQAFGNLTNLECVEMRDFSSRRSRDDTFWRSYGATTFCRETGSQLEIPTDRTRMGWNAYDGNDIHGNYPAGLFTTLLIALGRAGSRPKQFQAILRHLGLRDVVFNIPEYIEPTVGPVLNKLTCLYLDLGLLADSALVETSGGDIVPCSGLYLKRFLSRLPQLEHLRLNFRDSLLTAPKDLLLWLSQHPSPTITPQPVNFSNLQHLDIGMITLEVQTILAVLSKFKTSLRDVSLHRVTLSLPDGSQSDEKINLWARLFTQLPKLGLGLTGIQVTEPWAQIRDGGTFTAYFQDTVGRKKCWTGQDFDGACKDFAENVVINWPPPSIDIDNESEVESVDNEDGTDNEDDSDSDDDMAI